MTTPRQELAKYASQQQLSNIFTDYMGIVNAKIYGCAGDGVTSDTSNLQLAVTAANDSSKYAIFLPQGKYLVSSTLANTSDILWWGDHASWVGTYTAAIKQLANWQEMPAGSTVGDVFTYSSTGFKRIAAPASTAGSTGYFLMGSSSDPLWSRPDHGELLGTSDDDHAQYLLGRPANTTLGDMLYINASSAWDRMARGTTDQFIGYTSDGIPAPKAVPDPDKVLRIGHTYTIGGTVSVASTDVDYINPFFVSLANGQTASIGKVRGGVQLGTNATVKLQKNSSDMAGFTGIVLTTDPASTTAAAVSLADDDKIAMVVTATSGTPKNLSLTIFVDYTQ